MVVEKVQFRHFSWLHKVERLLKILIFHDACTEMDFVIKVLEQGGFTPILECVSSLDTLQSALRRQEWDVVIAEHGASETELLKSLRLVKAVAFDLPLIIIADAPEEILVTRMLREGADAFLLKAQLGRLAPTIDHELRKREHRRGFEEKALAVEEACKTTESMVTGLLHEMHSTMCAEQQLLEFMRQGRFGDMEEGQHALLEEIILSKRQTGQLVENIFWIFAQRDDEPCAPLARVDLNRLIGRDVMPAFHRDVQYKQLALQVNLDPELPEVDMDVPGIGMVLRNLIQIAINQTQPGGELGLATYVQGAYVVFAIKNPATTLDAECLERVFEQSNAAGVQPRFRSPMTFGLYLCQKILDACHGELGLDSGSGQGSAFLMKLPIPVDN